MKVFDVFMIVVGIYVLIYELIEVFVVFEDVSFCKCFFLDFILRFKGVIGFGGYSIR